MSAEGVNEALDEARRRYQQHQDDLLTKKQEKAIAKVQEAIRLRQATQAAGMPAAPVATGVGLVDDSGHRQAVFDDGSVRNLYQRKPGISGRQFRKARKRAQREWVAERRAEAVRKITDTAAGTPVAAE